MLTILLFSTSSKISSKLLGLMLSKNKMSWPNIYLQSVLLVTFQTCYLYYVWRPPSSLLVWLFFSKVITRWWDRIVCTKRGRSIITTRVISIYGGKLDLDHDVKKMFLIGSNGQLDLKDRIYGLHSQHEVGGLKVLWPHSLFNVCVWSYTIHRHQGSQSL